MILVWPSSRAIKGIFFAQSLYYVWTVNLWNKKDICHQAQFFIISHVGVLLKLKFSKKTYLIVIKDETGLKFKMNDYFISDWVVRSKIGSIILKNGEITQCLQKTET